VPGLPTTLGVALEVIQVLVCAGVLFGLFALTRAATPATCGVAIEVPLIVFVAVFDPIQSEVMEDPGANTSRQVPKLEKEERASVFVVAPTVMAFGTRAGEPLHALALSLPAATTTTVPPEMQLLIALSSAVDAPPPRDILATFLFELALLVT